MSIEQRRWLSVQEAAEYTGTDCDWILDHIKNGALKYVQTARRKRQDGPGRRRLRIDRLKLDALMERLETVATPATIPIEPDEKPMRPPHAARLTLRERLAEEG